MTSPPGVGTVKTFMDATARRRVLETTEVFAAVPRADLAVLAEMMSTERYVAGASVVDAGARAELVFVVATGTLSVFLPGRPEAVRRLGAGDVIGEYGMLSEAVRTASVVADEDTILLSLDYSRFRAYLLRFPEALWVLFAGTVERLLDAERR